MTSTLTIPRSTVEQVMRALRSHARWDERYCGDPVPANDEADALLALDSAKREALARQEPSNGGRTGHPPGMLQDDDRKLSKWLASRPDSKLHAKEAAQAIRQEPTEAQSAAAQEPIGFMNAGQVLDLKKKRAPYGYVYPTQKMGSSIAVYLAAPQPAVREWVGLSNAEWEVLEFQHDNLIKGALKQAVEAKLREKNGGAA